MMLTAYLAADDVMDWHHPTVRDCAASLAVPGNILATAQRCFVFVRDEIRHTVDAGAGVVTCRASDVLQAQTGYCYAKSHLLAALLRANGIPAGLCYQRLRVGEHSQHFCLHGLNGVYLPKHGWYRVDARGNKPGVNAAFDPPREQLAFPLQEEGEFDYPGIWSSAWEEVVSVLSSGKTWQAVLKTLPDRPAQSRPLMPGQADWTERDVQP